MENYPLLRHIPVTAVSWAVNQDIVWYFCHFICEDGDYLPTILLEKGEGK